jgi:hypothetical protein
MLAQETPRVESSANVDVNMETWCGHQGFPERNRLTLGACIGEKEFKDQRGSIYSLHTQCLQALPNYPFVYCKKCIIIYMFEIDLAHYLMSRRNLKNIFKSDIGVQSTSYIFASKGTRDVYLNPYLQ